MQVYKIGIAEIAISPIASKLKSALYLGPTLWLVSGGSNIKLSVEIMERIDSELSSNLTISLVDERYGAYNHPNSNWAQLMNAGFDAKNAKLIEVLTPDSNNLEITLAKFKQELMSSIDESMSIIGQFGMGSDGHIAGILPGSIATQETNELVIGYEATPFTRITITFNTFRKLTTAFLIATGEEKKVQLERLINQDLTLSEQPAQIIKQISESYIYNDQIEGKQ